MFSPYLDKKPFVYNNFCRSGMYSLIPIPQCSLCAEKACNYIHLQGAPHLGLSRLWSLFLVEIPSNKARYQCRMLFYSA